MDRLSKMASVCVREDSSNEHWAHTPRPHPVCVYFLSLMTIHCHGLPAHRPFLFASGLCIRCFLAGACLWRLKSSDTGNRTPSYRVKGGNVSRYTISDCPSSGISMMSIIMRNSNQHRSGIIVTEKRLHEVLSKRMAYLRIHDDDCDDRLR